MKHKNTTSLPKSLKLSPRRKVILTKNDIFRINKLTESFPEGWKSELKANTSIDYRTVENALINGYTELKVIDRLRNYLDNLDIAAEQQII